MLRTMKTGMLVFSVFYIIIGLLLLIMPATALLWICYAFGAVVLVTGLSCLLLYARQHGSGFAAPLMLVCGVVTTGLGIFTLFKPQTVASFLPVVFGLFILVDGVNRIASGIELAKRKGQKWWILLLFGIVSAALGILLVWHPFSAAVSITMLCGIMLVVEGALNLGCTLYTLMELRALDRLAQTAINAALAATGDALDEQDEAADEVVYEASATELPPEETDFTPGSH